MTFQNFKNSRVCKNCSPPHAVLRTALHVSVLLSTYSHISLRELLRRMCTLTWFIMRPSDIGFRIVQHACFHCAWRVLVTRHSFDAFSYCAPPCVLGSYLVTSSPTSCDFAFRAMNSQLLVLVARKQLFHSASFFFVDNFVTIPCPRDLKTDVLHSQEPPYSTSSQLHAWCLNAVLLLRTLSFSCSYKIDARWITWIVSQIYAVLVYVMSILVIMFTIHALQQGCHNRCICYVATK